MNNSNKGEVKAYVLGYLYPLNRCPANLRKYLIEKNNNTIMLIVDYVYNSVKHEKFIATNSAPSEFIKQKIAQALKELQIDANELRIYNNEEFEDWKINGFELPGRRKR